MPAATLLPPLDRTVTLARARPLAQGLKLWLPFPSSRGQPRVRDVVAANDATLQNAPTWATHPQIGAGLTFDAATNYVDHATFSWPTGTPATVSWWQWADSSPQLDNASWSIGHQANPDKFFCHAPYGGDGNLYWDYGDASGAGRLSASYTAYYDKWTHCCVVSSGSANTFKAIYLDGRLITSATSSAGPTVALTGYRLGRGTAGGYDAYFKGRIADFRVWNRLLAPAEVAALYAESTRWSSLVPVRLRTPAVTILVQVAYPAADVSDGSWTNEAGSNTNLYASLDETTASDGDFIQSSQSPASADVVKVRLGALADPAVGTGHVLRLRYFKDAAAGDRIDLTWTLYAADGTTVIKTDTLTDIGSGPTDLQITLTTGEANAIPSGDYSAGLILSFSAVKV